MSWLKKAGHKISNSVKKLGKSVSFKRGAVATVLGGPVAGLAVGMVSNLHNKNKACKKNKYDKSIFPGNGCCNKARNTGCGNANKLNSCGGQRNIDRGYGCNKPMNQMNNNMMMGMFNNIINRLISILQQAISNRGLSQPQILNTYNTYNTYPTVNRNIFNTTNQNISNITYDNDIINTNVNGIGNSVFADA